MIIVLATIESTVGDIDALRETIIALEVATRKEPGNISYSFNTQVANPNVIQVVESWETLDALAYHLKTPHVAEFTGTMANHPPKSMVANAYDVAKEVAIPMPS